MANTRVKKVLKGILLGFLILVALFILIGITYSPSDEEAQTQISNPAVEAPIVVSPSAESLQEIDKTTQIKDSLPPSLADLVKSATETEPGRVKIETTIVDPRGQNGSPQAQQALEICNIAVSQGYTYVALMENDGTHYVLFGHPRLPGETCSEY